MILLRNKPQSVTFQRRPTSCISSKWPKNSMQCTLGMPFLGVLGKFDRNRKGLKLALIWKCLQECVLFWLFRMSSNRVLFSPSCRVSSAGPFASSCSTINVNAAVRSKRRTETSANTVAFRSACLWACPTTVSVPNTTQFWCSVNCFSSPFNVRRG